MERRTVAAPPLSLSSSCTYLASIFMIKLWPSTPAGQLTPKAVATHHDRNPFDLLPPPSPSRSSSASPACPTTPTATSYHPLLGHSPAGLSHSANADITSPLGTPTLAGFPAAQPTTQLSLHAPDFNFKMQQPPVPSRKTLPNKPSAPSPSPALHTATSTPQVTSSRGQIHVKLIQARGLNVHKTSARPYVVVQFEQNEFVGRDPTAETDKEVKGTPTNSSRNNSSNAVSALGAIGNKATALDTVKRDKTSTNTSPASSVSSGKSIAPLSNGLFGRLFANNPVWKHEVSL